MQLTLPFADQDGPGPQVGLSLIELGGKFSDVRR